jgi:hypothetical protein
VIHVWPWITPTASRVSMRERAAVLLVAALAGWKITIDDGSGPLLVFVPVGAKVDVGGIRPGQRLRVVEFSGSTTTIARCSRARRRT